VLIIGLSGGFNKGFNKIEDVSLSIGGNKSSMAGRASIDGKICSCR